MNRIDADIVIVGIGLSACSLVLALLDQGYRGNIVMLERARRVNTNKTWCFWQGRHIPHYFKPLICKIWHSWRIGNNTQTITQENAAYCCIKGDDFYQFYLKRCSAAGNVTMLFDSSVSELGNLEQGVFVRSQQHHVNAKLGFDSRFVQPRVCQNNSMLQCFAGAWVSSSRSLFSGDTAGLMTDIRCVERAVEFTYLLPFDECHALVEITRFSSEFVAPEILQKKTREELKKLGLNEKNVINWEEGVLPMSANVGSRINNDTVNGRYSRWHTIGINNGTIRASTGYAFACIQRESQKIANNIMTQEWSVSHVIPKQYQWLDSIFLRVLSQRPELASEIFNRMASGTSPEQFIRFMTEQATLFDLLTIIKSMPKGPFLRAAWEQAKCVHT